MTLILSDVSEKKKFDGKIVLKKSYSISSQLRFITHRYENVRYEDFFLSLNLYKSNHASIDQKSYLELKYHK